MSARINHCVNCGAALSVIRMTACCDMPMPDLGYRQAVRDLNRVRDDGSIPATPSTEGVSDE